MTSSCQLLGYAYPRTCHRITFLLGLRVLIAFIRDQALFASLTIIVGFIGGNGGARHVYYLSIDQAKYVLKLNYIAQPFGIVAVGTGKIAVGLMILRLFGSASLWRKRALWSLLLLTAIITILTAIFTYTQCNIPAALWEPSLRATTYCWNPSVQSNFSIFSASWNAFMDFILAAWPMMFILRLHLTARKRNGLILLLGLGSLSGVAAAFKTAQLVSLAARSDLTWETFQLFIWVSVEITIIILCGSVPAMKPLWDRFISQGRFGNTNSSQRYWRYGSKSSYFKSSSNKETLQGHELSEIGNAIGATSFVTTAKAPDDGNFSADTSSLTPINLPQLDHEAIHVTRSVQVNWGRAHGT